MQSEIARVFSVHQGTIGRRLKKWGVVRPVIDYIDKVIKMYVKGNYTQREISKYFGVSVSTVSGNLRKLGIYSKDLNRSFVKTKLRINIPKEIVQNLYWNKKLNMAEIAEKFKCSRSAISRRMIEYNILRRTKKESAKRGKDNPRYGKPMSKESKRKLIRSIISNKKEIKSYGKGNGAYYDTPNQGRKWMRSSWEIKVADYLTENNVDWFYEYAWLKINKEIYYLPDFYLPDKNYYIEVKGWKTERTMKKYKLAKEFYNIKLWDQEELRKRKIV